MVNILFYTCLLIFHLTLEYRVYTRTHPTPYLQFLLDLPTDWGHIYTNYLAYLSTTVTTYRTRFRDTSTYSSIKGHTLLYSSCICNI